MKFWNNQENIIYFKRNNLRKKLLGQKISGVAVLGSGSWRSSRLRSRFREASKWDERENAVIDMNKNEIPRRKTNKKWSDWDVGETIYEDSGEMTVASLPSARTGRGQQMTKDNSAHACHLPHTETFNWCLFLKDKLDNYLLGNYLLGIPLLL